MTDYTKPATTFLKPPPGGALWCIWLPTHEGAKFLVEDLSHLATVPTFGAETWEDDDKALVVIDYPMTAPGIVKAVLANYGKVIETGANLDITGQYAQGSERALELLS